MENFILPEKVFGTIKVYPKDWADQYYIGDARLSIQKIKGKTLFNIWAQSYHYEIHGEHKVKMGDISFEIMMPIEEDFEAKEIELYFPIADSEIHDNWEKFYFSHFYNFEHFQIVNCSIKITPKDDQYKLELKGHITDDIEKYSDDHYFESTLELPISPTIQSFYNGNFSTV